MNTWEQDILVALAGHVRFLSLAQVARGWFSGQRRAERQALRCMRRLVERGWADVRQVFARPVQPLREPVCQWHHGQSMPCFVDIVRQLHRRARLWAGLTTVWTGTRRTRVLFGRGGQPVRIKLTQVTHDLELGEIYLHYRAQGFDVRRSWVLEDALSVSWPLRQRPDALLLDPAGHFLRAVEYGGDYSVARLVALHRGLASLPLAYEVW